MILQSLVDYYEILADKGEISKPGYCMANISYDLKLSSDGTLLGVIPLKIQVQRGKKTMEVPQSMQVPEQEKKTSGIKSNFFCENASYILGADKNGKSERIKRCFEAFAELHHKVLDDVDCVQAKAILSFERKDKNSPVRKYSDYVVKVDEKAIPDGVTCTRMI